jgi:hypothetical protein
MRNDETGEVIKSQTSIETTDEQAEARAVVDKLARSFKSTVDFYKACYTPEDMKKVEAMIEGDRTEQGRERARNQPPREVSWYDISLLADGDMNEALEVWGRVRLLAIDELESGMYSAQVVGEHTPLERARFLAIRDSLLDSWQSRNGIESALLEMMAQTFSLFLYWTAIAHERATNRHDKQQKETGRFETSGWKSPYQSEVDAIDQAHRLADSYNRQFLRTLRQLRDLRRYVPPVIVNNGGQVNVAADGGQQVNLTS